MAKAIISTGHYGKGMCLPGAVGNGYKEAQEAEKIVNRVGQILGKYASTFTDKTSTSQSQNLKTIAAHHNSKARDLDVSIHFNSAGFVATGVEVLYTTQKKTAAKWSKAISKTLGLNDRGGKYRPELFFLRKTAKPALLIETCFISNSKDMKAYKENFEALCQTIAKLIAEFLEVKLEGSKEPSKPTDKPLAPSTGHQDEVYHVVKKGETLYGISKDHNITVDKLKELNGLNSNVIGVGSKLRVK